MNNDKPIGIFDSGVGGLSVARSIRDLMPGEDLLYIADSHYAPYGEKSNEIIEQRCFTLVDFLLRQNAKAVVVACNTATVSTIKKLRATFAVPIIGIEPGIKPAVSVTNSGVVGVLATQKTITSQSFNDFVSGFTGTASIVLQACPGLVEQVEKLDLEGPQTRSLIKQYVLPLLDKGVDTIVLGCTHYNFLTRVIQEIASTQVEIINTSEAVAKEVARRLTDADLLSTHHHPGDEKFFTSGDSTVVKRVISALWGKIVEVSAMRE